MNETKSRRDQDVTIRTNSALITERKINKYTLDKIKIPYVSRDFGFLRYGAVGGI
jgi:hypothetical protein